MGCVANTGNPIKSVGSHSHIRESNISTSKKPKKKYQAIDNRLKSIDYSDILTAVFEDRKKQEKDVQLIQSAIKKHFIFNSLSPSQVTDIINNMKFYTLLPDTTIFEQNSTGNNFFIIHSGKVEMLINDVRKSILKLGDSFGELALLHGTLRVATARALEKTSLWTIDRKTFRQVAYSINTLSYKENKAFLENISIFQVLTEQQKEQLLNSLNTQSFPGGVFIVNDGDPGELFYIIKEGKVEVIKDFLVIREMNKGDYFGEQALLYKQNRTASVRTVGNVVCLCIGADDLNKALGNQLQNIIYKNSLKIAIENDCYLKKLTKAQIESLSSAICVYSYKNQQVLANFGTGVGFNLFVVVKGKLKMGEKEFSLFSCVSSKEFCGNSEENLSDDLTACEDSDIGVISIEHFEKIIGGVYKEVSLFNEILSTLLKIPLFSTLQSNVLNRILKSLKPLEFEQDSIIFEESQLGDSLFIILSGEVTLNYSQRPSRTLSTFDYFGKRSLLFLTSRTCTAISQTKSRLLYLARSDFLDHFPESTKSQLLTRIELQDNKISLQDLNIIKLIGKGMFGNVFLTVHKTRKTYFAVKTVDRKKISAYSLHNNVIHERKVLLLLDHCMVMKLVKTFKDSMRVYFLLEHVLGVDMFDVLRTLQVLTEADAKFYAACLVDVLEYVHSKGIVYRDLKPENLVIDSEGYPKLIDFGISKIISGRTFSLVGTPHYMAPEVIEGKGYGITADYWSLGVMIYEFICGSLPFGDEESEPFAIYNQILNLKFEFPPFIDSKSPSRHFISQLLSSNPALRSSKNQDLKSHPLFLGINWDKLLSKQIKPPYIPSIPNQLFSNLDPTKDFFSVILSEELKDTLKPTNFKSEANENWDNEF